MIKETMQIHPSSPLITLRDELASFTKRRQESGVFYVYENRVKGYNAALSPQPRTVRQNGNMLAPRVWPFANVSRRSCTRYRVAKPASDAAGRRQRLSPHGRRQNLSQEYKNVKIAASHR